MKRMALLEHFCFSVSILGCNIKENKEVRRFFFYGGELNWYIRQKNNKWVGDFDKSFTLIAFLS